MFGKVLSSPLAGQVIAGAAEGIGRGAELRERERQDIAAEERRGARYSGLGEAMGWSQMPRLSRQPTAAPVASRPRVRYDRASRSIVRD